MAQKRISPKTQVSFVEVWLLVIGRWVNNPLKATVDSQRATRYDLQLDNSITNPRKSLQTCY